MSEKLIKVNGNQIQVADDVLEKMKILNETKNTMLQLEKDVKDALKDAMEANGVKSIENEVFKATYVEETSKTILDKDKVKAFCSRAGIKLSEFEKESQVKSSLRIKYK